MEETPPILIRRLGAYSRKYTLHSPRNMTMTIRIGITVTFLTFVSCVHSHKLYSSYFTFSHQKQESKDCDKIAEFKAETELTCALRCSTKGTCDEVTYNRDSERCFLYQNKEKRSTEPYAGDDNARLKIVTMKKVRNVFKPGFRYRNEFY